MKTLVEIVESKLDTDASPFNKAPSRLACAETVSTILQEYLRQFDISFPIVIGTPELASKLRNSDLFEQVYDPKAGDVVMAETGTSTTPWKLSNGHTGFYLDETRIASNDSETGHLKQNYTRETFRDLFHYFGGYPIRIYRLKKLQ